MNILSHGLPFFCDYATLRQYRGPHVIRSLGAQAGADFRLRPEAENLDDLLRRIAPEFKPDLILVWTPENDPPPLGIERSPVRTACLAGDWNLFANAQRYNYGRYDVVLSDRPGVKVISNDFCSPSFLFPLYAQNTLIHRDIGLERDIDVLYCGNLNLSHRKERGHWLQKLAGLSNRYKIVLTANAWGDEYAKLHSRAKIVFNHSVRGELNLRVFESMACGALVFFEESNAEVHDFFEDGKDLILYNEENFDDKLDYYLSNPDAARAIAEHAKEKVATFAGEARFDALVDYILQQPESGRPFLGLDQKERDLQDYLMVTVSQRKEYGPLDKKLGAYLRKEYPDEPRAQSSFGRSILYYRDRPEPRERGSECLNAFKTALQLDPSSGVHALNAATAARYYEHKELEKLFLQVALKTTQPHPGGYLWGSWVSQHYTRWLRLYSEGKHSIESIHAEAHARTAAMEEGQALAHLERARALDPDNTDVITGLGDALWAAGRRAESVSLLNGTLSQFPLLIQHRVTLAERNAALGYTVRAGQLLDEAQAIGNALQLNIRREMPRSHAAKRQAPRRTVAEFQEERLRQSAEQTGVWRGYVVFLSTLRRLHEIDALRPTLDEKDRVAADVLMGRGKLEGQIDAVAETGDAFLFHSLMKSALRVNDLPLAGVIADAAMRACPEDVTVLNVFAKVLSQQEEKALLQRTIERSLSIAPQQQDIAALLDQPFEGEIYLDPLPRFERISFYLPAYNVGEFIGGTLERIFGQDYPLHEVVVVDDGSSDNSIDIARNFPVTLVSHDKNRGLAAARNTALVESSGTWLASVDTDASPEPDFLSRMMLELESASPALAAIGGMLIEHHQQDIPDKWRARMMAQHHGAQRQQPPPFLFGSTMCVHRETVIAVGGYDEAHRTNGEDTELCKDFLRNGKTYVYTPLPRAHHMRRDSLQSVMRTWWGWYYWVKMEASAYEIVGGLVHALSHSLAQAATNLNRFLGAGEHELLYFTFLLPFYDAFADLNHAAGTGLLLPEEVVAIRQLLLSRIKELDGRYNGALYQKVRADAEGVLTAHSSAESAALSRSLLETLQPYLDMLDTFLNSIGGDVYKLLANDYAKNEKHFEEASV